MSVTGRSNEPYYRREFKQEQSLYEETSNLGITHPAEGSCFNQPYHYVIFTLVALLFLGSICLLSLDLLFARRRDDDKPADRRRSHAQMPPPRRSSAQAPPRIIVHDANSDATSDVPVIEQNSNNSKVFRRLAYKEMPTKATTSHVETVGCKLIGRQRVSI
ncbi:hypothetical protein GE061_000286 [Apolygus lucorum]|uniref:Uncharacterized protein n=1 Tax=Apolygus lucorum TaxID=248454 RepID=A0A6A4KAY8_APOLU|nr:hypothetical protein GE061_000286 [Apolygus lucorum]